MSYCRFSSADFDSDVYVYTSADGWVTHVASTRIEPIAEFPAPVDFEPREDEAAWARAVIDRQRKIHAILDASPATPIGLPHDGSHFLDASPGDCAGTLSMLAGAGYRVPDDVIEDLRAEQSDMDATG